MADFGRGSPALEAQQLVGFFHPLGVELSQGGKGVHLAGIYHPDKDRIGPNAVFSFFLGDAFHQLFVGRLDRDGHSVARWPPVMSGRAEVHETTAAHRAHVRDEQLDGGEQAMDFYVEGVTPLIHRGLGQVALVDERPCSPDDRVYSAMLGNGFVDGGVEPVGIGYIGGVGARLAAERAGLLGGFLRRPRLGAIDQRHITARLGKGTSDPATDAAAAAEHQRTAGGKGRHD